MWYNEDMKLTIIYYSRGGNTKLMAKAVQAGALEAGAEVNLKKATETTADDVLNCDAVVFGSPNYFSYMAGAIQTVLEECFIKLTDKEATRPYAVFASAGTMGGKPAIESIEEICNRFGGKFGKFKFKKAAEGVGTPAMSSPGKPSAEILEKCRELGREMAFL
jgi:multimeric flavodoxin WrbA